MKKRSFLPSIRQTVKLIIKIVIGIMLLSIVLIFLLRWFNPPLSAIIVERKVSSWLTSPALSIKQQWQDWDNISGNIKIAVIASEDQQFPFHYGFDFVAISQALKHNAAQNSLRGASTISQQVAKNVFLWSSRSWLRKGLEAWMTFWIEILWSKQRILEVYLNIVEWGNGIFGIEAASQYYFNRSAKQLTRQQASLLAAILPNPRYWSPVKPSNQTQERARWILQQMNNLGETEYLDNLSENRDYILKKE